MSQNTFLYQLQNINTSVTSRKIKLLWTKIEFAQKSNLFYLSLQIFFTKSLRLLVSNVNDANFISSYTLIQSAFFKSSLSQFPLAYYKNSSSFSISLNVLRFFFDRSFAFSLLLTVSHCSSITFALYCVVFSIALYLA